MTLSELFDTVLAKPGMYVGNRSIIKLRAFLDGYHHAKCEENVSVSDSLYRGFTPWIAQHFDIRTSHNWTSIISFMSGDEVHAFELTKELWEEYKATMRADAKILVSACLLGQKVRYDGSDKDQSNDLLNELIVQNRFVAICPEVAGGLGVPRLPAEIQNGMGEDVLDGKASVIDSVGKDVTAEFVSGAQQALALAQASNVRVAILKARSPSCGNAQIYDGRFRKHLLAGRGVTAALLERHGIKVFNEDEIAAAIAYAAELNNEG